jgi:hypothetical protein
MMALKKGTFSACIILGWGSGDDMDIGLTFTNNSDNAFQKNLVQWVAQGGWLIVQGGWMSQAAGNWPAWFGLMWKLSD